MGVGDKIKLLRKTRNMTLKELAEKIGVHFGSLSNIEKGTRNPSLDMLDKIAEALEISVNEFFDGENVDENKVVKENNDSSIEKDLPIVPEEFTNANEARAYVDKHQIFGSSGFDADNLSDDEILEFANELLRQMEMISYKYKK